VSDALQDRYSPEGTCFGCGPKNDKGLRIKSRVEGDEVVADFVPEAHHQAFPGMLNGGIIGALLDCHSNWTAAHHLMKALAMDAPPCTVTADFHVKLRKPTPLGPVHLQARVVEASAGKDAPPDAPPDRCLVEAELLANGEITARCKGTFVAVKEGHPAYHRW
jgi:acyl-coenzyme A thioesterase PaaI-like protein